MGERKVLNFYVSPDFDASIIPRQKRDRTKLIEVRTMLPFSMRCNTCGEYHYRGKKFTAKKEDIQGETYMVNSYFHALGDIISIVFDYE